MLKQTLSPYTEQLLALHTSRWSVPGISCLAMWH